MNTLHPRMAQALAPFMQPITPPIGTAELLTAIRRWSRSDPSHSELADVLYLMASAVKQNGSLTDKCARSAVDQLQELAKEVDQDAVNQAGQA